MERGKYFMVVLLLTLVTATVCAQVIPVYRITDWSKAGYPGKIPAYPVVKNITDYGGTGNSTNANDQALQAAIASLNNQPGIVFFPAGTFLFNKPILLSSGIVLKGEGAGNTTLLFNLAGANDLIKIAGAATGTVANITATVYKDSGMVLADNASLFRVNDYVKIYQNDAALINNSWALESVGQIVQIDKIEGNYIYFSDVVRRNYLLADAPRIRKLAMVTGVGIECLKVKRMDATALQTSNIYFSTAANCWVRGVESEKSNFAHVNISGSTHIEVSNSYFHSAFAYGGGGKGYGVTCELTSGNCKIENNIFRQLRHAMLLQAGANGNVFSYNYSLQPFNTDTFPFNLSGDMVLHGNYPYQNLFEGNIVQNIIADVSHGINGPFNTFLRNRAELYGIFIVEDGGDSTNIVGNEITGAGYQQGNYYLQGSGNFEYGNMKKDTLVPEGTTQPFETSYLYSSTPSFWNIAAGWPSIGRSNLPGTKTIPAKQRFLAANGLTFCLSDYPVTYIFTGSGQWSVAANWANNNMPPVLLSAGSKIVIDPPEGQKCVLDISYVMNPGASLTVKEGKQFEVTGSLTMR